MVIRSEGEARLAASAGKPPAAGEISMQIQLDPFQILRRLSPRQHADAIVRDRDPHFLRARGAGLERVWKSGTREVSADLFTAGVFPDEHIILQVASARIVLI